MIPNPPHIVGLLRAFAQLRRHGVSGGPLTSMLAILFSKHLGQLSWKDFLGTYHLYLQSIPLDLAKAAWGLNSAMPANSDPKQS